MMGYSHVMSGMAAGLIVLPWAPVGGAAEQIAWVLVWGGAALLPDLDSPNASAARMWGPISRAISLIVGALARGHRQGTHDLILSPVVFGALTSLALLVPPLAVVVVAVTLGLVFHALRVTRICWVGPLVNFVLSWVVAIILVDLAPMTIGWWLALAVAGGVLVAIAGDWLTTEGIPVPLVWIRDRSRRWGLRAFRTGADVEALIVAPLLTVGTVLLFSARLS